MKFFYAILCFLSLTALFSTIIYLDGTKILIFKYLTRPVGTFNDYTNEVDDSIFQTSSEEFLSCQVPKLNPWDPMILKGIFHPKSMSCKKVQPYLTFIDDDGYLRLNETESKYVLEENNRTFSCYYLTFIRRPISIDSRIQYDDELQLTKPTRLKRDYVRVECYWGKKTDDSDRFYFNLHAHPSQSRNVSLFNEPTEDQLSVFVYLLDSVSYSSFQRNLPLTLNYTSNVMGVKYLKALNKVGDNSWPNIVAMFAGKRVDAEQEDMPPEIPGDFSTMQFDSLPMIWKLFSNKRYATVFNEDNPQVGTFHFERRGFAKQPVDYYHHIFWTAVQAESNHDYVCFKNSLKAHMIMDLTKRQVIQMKDKLQFLLTITMELSHDNDNEVEMLDNDLKTFWQELYESGHLNKSAVIFASDHGIRHGWIRKTLVGLIEERLPFFGLWFPKWFYEKHPHIEKNIEENAEILSSSYDVYETLTDILNANWHNGSQRDAHNRGQSQLYPLPKNRTCNQAGIPDHYCTCSIGTDLPLNDTLVEEGANFLAQYLNFLLRNVSDICHNITLKKILFAKSVEVNDKVKHGVHNREEILQYKAGKLENKIFVVTKEIRIAIETHPHKAMFDVLLRKQDDGQSKSWSVVGRISRSSRYRGLSDCVHDRDLRKYCSCRDVPLNE